MNAAAARVVVVLLLLLLLLLVTPKGARLKQSAASWPTQAAAKKREQNVTNLKRVRSERGWNNEYAKGCSARWCSHPNFNNAIFTPPCINCADYMAQ